jgi:hypothetical protein
MVAENAPSGFIELFDLTKNLLVAKFPLAHLKFIPRKGERILVSSTGPGDWNSYRIVDVEYFYVYDPDTKTPETASQAGKITLYVEPSEKKSN